jgi:hypothetical protein
LSWSKTWKTPSSVASTNKARFLFILDFVDHSSDTIIRFTGLLAYSCALFCHRYPADV